MPLFVASARQTIFHRFSILAPVSSFRSDGPFRIIRGTHVGRCHSRCLIVVSSPVFPCKSLETHQSWMEQSITRGNSRLFHRCSPRTIVIVPLALSRRVSNTFLSRHPAFKDVAPELRKSAEKLIRISTHDTLPLFLNYRCWNPR